MVVAVRSRKVAKRHDHFFCCHGNLMAPERRSTSCAPLANSSETEEPFWSVLEGKREKEKNGDGELLVSVFWIIEPVVLFGRHYVGQRQEGNAIDHHHAKCSCNSKSSWLTYQGISRSLGNLLFTGQRVQSQREWSSQSKRLWKGYPALFGGYKVGWDEPHSVQQSFSCVRQCGQVWRGLSGCPQDDRNQTRLGEGMVTQK